MGVKGLVDLLFQLGEGLADRVKLAHQPRSCWPHGLFDELGLTDLFAAQ
jgi:hypothetical protein